MSLFLVILSIVSILLNLGLVFVLGYFVIERLKRDNEDSFAEGQWRKWEAEYWSLRELVNEKLPNIEIKLSWLPVGKEYKIKETK